MLFSNGGENICLKSIQRSQGLRVNSGLTTLCKQSDLSAKCIFLLENPIFKLYEAKKTSKFNL